MEGVVVEVAVEGQVEQVATDGQATSTSLPTWRREQRCREEGREVGRGVPT